MPITPLALAACPRFASSVLYHLTRACRSGAGYGLAFVGALSSISVGASSLLAQTPPSVTVSPVTGTHVTSATVMISMTACADNTMDDFQTVLVNGTAYTALSAGGLPRGCGSSQAGAWGANVTLSPGSNDVEAQVCDDSGNCGSAFTTIIYDAPPSYAVTVTADQPTITTRVVTQGSTTFTVKNTGGVQGTINVSVSCPALSSCTASPASRSTATSESYGVNVAYLTSGTSGSASITLTASYSESPNTSASATTTLTVNPAVPTLAVDPDNSPRSVAPGTQTVSFSVSNTGRDSQDVDLSASCGSFSGCAALINGALFNNPVQIGAGATQSVTVQFSVSPTQQGVSSPVSLTASACNSINECGSDAGSYVVTYPLPTFAVQVTPTPASFTTTVNTTGSTAFKIKNTGQSAGTIDLTTSCVGMAPGACNVNAPTSLSLNPGDSATATVGYTAQSSAKSNASITLTATYHGTSVSGSGTAAVNILQPPQLAVTPQGQPLSVSAGQQTVFFQVLNLGPSEESVTITPNCVNFPTCDTRMGGTPIIGPVSIPSGGVDTVQADFTVTTSQAGISNKLFQLTATADDAGGHGESTGSYSVSYPVTVRHGVVVTPTIATVTLPSRTTVDTAVFTVHDTSGNAGSQTYTLSASCSGVVACTSAIPGTVTLADSGSATVKVPVTVSLTGAGGIVQLTATSSTASGSGIQTVITTASYVLAITPATHAQSVLKGSTGSYAVTVQNSSTNSRDSMSISLAVTTCGSPVLANCQAPAGSFKVAEGESGTQGVTFQAAQSGVGILAVTASATVDGTSVGSSGSTDSVTVTNPPPATIAVTPANDSINLVAPKDTSVTFTIATTETTAEQISYTISCAGAVIRCRDTLGLLQGVVGPLVAGGQSSQGVKVLYSLPRTTLASGTITIAVRGVNSGLTAAGTRTVVISNPSPVIVDTRTPNPGPAIARDRCVTIAIATDAAYECGDLRLVHPLPATTTMNTSRAPMLMYNSRHGMPIALIAANVSMAPGLGVTNIDATVTLLNNSNQAPTTPLTQNFTWTAANNATAASRIVVPMYVRFLGLPTPLTGVYNYVFQVAAKAGTSVVATATDTGQVVIVDRTQSQFGNGWWLDGLEQLSMNTPSPTTTRLWIGGDGSARVYTQVASTNTFLVTPTLDRPDTLTQDATTHHYFRHLRNGGFVEFDATGKHITTQNAAVTAQSQQAHQTHFQYDPSTGLLSQITLPVPSGSGPSYTINTVVDAHGNMKSATITAPANGSRVRQTWLGTPPFVAGSSPTDTIFDADGSHVGLTYNPDGRIMSRIDRTGHATTFFYDAMGGSLARAGDSLTTGDPGLVHSFCPGESVGQALRGGVTETCALGPADTAAVRTVYNGPKLGNADTIEFQIDRFGAPTKIVDPFGATTTIERLDTNFPLLATHVRRSVGSQLLGDQTASYNARGLPDSVTVLVDTVAQLHATTRYTWHPVFDRVVHTINAAGEVAASSFDGTGRRVADTLGVNPTTKRVTSYRYTTADQVDSIIVPSVAGEANTTTVAYDGQGNLASTTSPLGLTTFIGRDGAGQDTSSRTPIDAGQTQFRTTTILRDILGRDSVNIAAGPQISVFTQNYTTTFDSVIVSTTYDREGRPIAVSRRVNPDPNSIGTLVSQTAYDEVGRVIRETAPDGFADATHYGDGANPTVHTNRRGQTITTTYDALDRRASIAVPAITDPFGVTQPAETDVFSYDAAGNLSRAANNFAVITRGYNALGLVVADTEDVATASLGFGQHQYVVGSTYDALGRRTRIVLPRQLQTPGFTYQFDEFGELDSASNNSGATDRAGIHYHYDARGRIDTVRFGNGIVDARTYDADDRLMERLQSNSNHHNCGPPTPSPLCWAFGNVPATDTIEADTLSYNAAGEIIQTNGLVEVSTAGYNGLGALGWTRMRNNRIPGQQTNEGYEVDALGNRFHLLDVGGSEDQVDRTYQFGRLLRTLPRTNNLAGAADAMIATYDRDGNQDTLSHVHQATGTLNNGPTTRLFITNVHNVYDALGHQRFLHERTAGDSGIKLDPSDDSTDIETRYDALGRRVWVQTRHVDIANCIDHQLPECSVQRFLWDGSALAGEIRMPLDTLAENDVNTVVDSVKVNRSITDPQLIPNYSWNWGSVAYLHAAGDEGIDVPVAEIRVGGGHPWDLDTTHTSLLFPAFPMYVHTDWRGKITALSFPGGAPAFDGNQPLSPPLPTAANATATPFGNRTAPRLSTSWVGSLMVDQQDEAGFQYRRNRYYDAATGRFTQEDPLGLAGGMNLYRFAAGDPVNFSDPFGLCPDPKDPRCESPGPILTFSFSINAAFGSLGANGQVGLAVNLRTFDAVTFIQGGSSMGAGLSIGPGIGVQKGSFNDLVETTEEGGGTSITATGGAASVTVPLAGNVQDGKTVIFGKPTGLSVGTKSPVGGFVNFSLGGKTSQPRNLIGPSDRSYQCAKVGTGCQAPAPPASP